MIALLEDAKSMQYLTLGHRINVIGIPGRLQQLANSCGETLRSLHCAVFTLGTLTSMNEPSVTPSMKSFANFKQLTDLR